jgi:hypothetical protein
MSEFRDFIKDFPHRCSDVLKFAFPQALDCDREVTLLLMAAAAAFVIPFERLRSDDHPTGDPQQYKEVASTLKSILGKAFLDGPFWPKAPASWRIGESDTVTGRPDSWPKFEARSEPTDKTPALQIFATLRNALSHGNLYIRGSLGQISEIVFVAEKRCGGVVGYRFACVTPDDFHLFLNKWFDYVEKQDIPQNVVAIALSAEGISR